MKNYADQNLTKGKILKMLDIDVAFVPNRVLAKDFLIFT